MTMGTAALVDIAQDDAPEAHGARCCRICGRRLRGKQQSACSGVCRAKASRLRYPDPAAALRHALETAPKPTMAATLAFLDAYADGNGVAVLPRPPGEAYCRQHHPDLAEERRESARKGALASNALSRTTPAARALAEVEWEDAGHVQYVMEMAA
jgi:hypothetical protein